MPPYRVVESRSYDARLHAPGTTGSRGECSLHGCGEPAVLTVVAEESGGGRVTLAVCVRGAEEYALPHQP